MDENKAEKNILWMEKVGIEDVPRVGGKNASLGEMIHLLNSKGVKVPSGFIITAQAYYKFMRDSGLADFVRETLEGLQTSNLKDLSKRAKLVRDKIEHTELPDDLKNEIRVAYKEMEARYGKNIDVAVRSSATAEDLPGASFAGEHETYLGIRGATEVIVAARAAMASLFTDRAISYRVDKHFDHFKVALSVGVQRMVRSDTGASGIIFTVDTESGFRECIIINAAYGLGELIVQGRVTPDEYIVSKQLLNEAPCPIVSKHLGVKNERMVYSPGKKGIRPVKIIKTTQTEKDNFVLTEPEIMQLAKWAYIIEKHYSEKAGKWTPMDMEWAKDGKTGELFIVQARPETVQAAKDLSKIREYERIGNGLELLHGISVGNAIRIGKARVILDAKRIDEFKEGEILVTTMTDPDWEPIMKIATAIVTDKGGRTSHAAIVSRELGIPAIVGTEEATKKIKTGDVLTIDASGTDGIVFKGEIAFKVIDHDLGAIPKVKTKVMINIATPSMAFEKSFLPVEGVGLAREEFIIATSIGIHPMALINYKKLSKQLQKKIDLKTVGWKSKTDYYIDVLAYGIGRIGLAFYPKPVIVRFSDFKTNEYRGLVGGDLYEPLEENPMIGWRGASRYYDPKFKEAFRLECKAMYKVRKTMGLSNVIPMVPFCRTPQEGIQTQEIMHEAGLTTKYIAKSRSLADVETTPVYVMCEIPSNILLADEFLAVFDGMSIGSNDLTQLTLGLDRDSGIVSHVSNENNEAVKKLIADIIKKCRYAGKYIGICGQAPSDYVDFAQFLVKAGIESMSLNPDTVIKTIGAIAEIEANPNATTN